MPRFEDCLSCAFHRVEPAICAQCDDADQWEPADYECMSEVPVKHPLRNKIKARKQFKKELEAA